MGLCIPHLILLWEPQAPETQFMTSGPGHLSCDPGPGGRRLLLTLPELKSLPEPRGMFAHVIPFPAGARVGCEVSNRDVLSG